MKDKKINDIKCEECHMYRDCKFCEQKTGKTLCEVVEKPNFMK